MRKMIAFLSAGFAYMDSCEPMLVEDDATEEEIVEDGWGMAVQHAARYGIYPRDEWVENEDVDLEEEDADSDSYSDNISWHAVDYVPELHDMYRSGGGSFEQDFARMM